MAITWDQFKDGLDREYRNDPSLENLRAVLQWKPGCGFGWQYGIFEDLTWDIIPRHYRVGDRTIFHEKIVIEIIKTPTQDDLTRLRQKKLL